MEKHKCSWCVGDDLYEAYHDLEWGKPVYDDDILFRVLMLETFQAGLSWITVLRKYDNFSKAFNNFDYQKIAQYNEVKLEILRHDAGIIRHKLKIKAAVTNAQAFLNIQQEFTSFSKYIWAFTDGKVIKNKWKHSSDIPAYTKLSETVSKDLKKRGFKFVGPTIVYAFLQASGIINDHELDCFRYHEV